MTTLQQRKERHLVDKEWALLQEALTYGVHVELALLLTTMAAPETSTEEVRTLIADASDMNVKSMARFACVALAEASIRKREAK